MQCRNCGTEIADKAIVCYRCGTSTTEPVRKPASIQRRTNPLASIVAAVVLLLLALYLGQASRTAANPEQWQTIAGVLAMGAIVLLILRMLRRRR
jgi:uncharacterized membrane protein YvbJ